METQGQQWFIQGIPDAKEPVSRHRERTLRYGLSS
jgi:hypothetical protein